MIAPPSPMREVSAFTQAKFYEDGSARPYPGNTIVAHVDPSTPGFDTLLSLVARLRQLPGAEAHTFLPPNSFHMTLFRGVNDQLRKAGEWPSDLPLDMPLDEVTALFRSRLLGVDIPGRFSMRPSWLAMNGAGDIQLGLEAVGLEEAEALEALRLTLAKRLRHQRSGDDGYRFHVTLSYRTRPVSVSRDEALAASLAAAFDELVRDCPPIIVVSPALCVYEDMLAFKPVLRLDRPAQ